MNTLPKFVKDLEDKIYTNVTLEFVDESETVVIDAHKDIVAFSCEYFDRMFRFNKSNHYQIIVSNAKSAINIIREFYGLPCHGDYLYTLNYLECRNFFGMSIDLNVLENLIVQPEHFEKYLRLVEIIFFTFERATDFRRMVRAIQMNVPSDYDTDLLPPILVKEFGQKSYIIKKADIYDNVIIRDSYTSKILLHYNRLNNDETTTYCDSKILCFTRTGETPIIIIDNLMQESILPTKNKFVNFISILPNQKYIITTERAADYDGNHLNCYDLATKICLWNIVIEKSFQVTHTSNGKKIICCTRSEIYIINSSNGTIIRIIELNIDRYHSIKCVMGPGKIFSVDIFDRKKSLCRLYNVDTCQLVKTFEHNGMAYRTFIINDNTIIFYYFQFTPNWIDRINIKTEKIVNHTKIPFFVIELKGSRDKKSLLLKSFDNNYALNISSDTISEITDIEFIELAK